MITRHGDRTTITQLPGDHHVWQCNLSTFMAPVDNQNPTASLGRIFRKNYLPGREPIPGNCYSGIPSSPSLYLSLPLPSILIYCSLIDDFLSLNRGTHHTRIRAAHNLWAKPSTALRRHIQLPPTNHEFLSNVDPFY